MYEVTSYVYSTKYLVYETLFMSLALGARLYDGEAPRGSSRVIDLACSIITCLQVNWTRLDKPSWSWLKKCPTVVLF